LAEYYAQMFRPGLAEFVYRAVKSLNSEGGE
jgi:hypothetical protein